MSQTQLKTEFTNINYKINSETDEEQKKKLTELTIKRNQDLDKVHEGLRLKNQTMGQIYNGITGSVRGVFTESMRINASTIGEYLDKLLRIVMKNERMLYIGLFMIMISMFLLTVVLVEN